MTCGRTPITATDTSPIVSHESFPTSSCDSCFGLIYDDDYSSNGEELDEDDEHYEDYGDEDDDEDADMDDDDEGSSGWDQSQSQSQSSAATSSICQSQVTDPFSMSSMSSFFCAPSPSPFPCPPSLAPRSSSKRKRSQHSQRCSYQKATSKGLWDIPSPAGAPAGPFSGNINGQNQSLSHSQNSTTIGTGTESQLSIFSNSNSTNGQNQTSNGFGTSTQAQVPTQTDSSQTLSQLLVANGRASAKDKTA